MNEETKLSLNIGQIIVVEDPSLISTVLGSCVSVCLFSPHKKMGGMIHYALPYQFDHNLDEDPLRYGDQAIPILIEEMRKLSLGPVSSLKAKIIGGANCLVRASGGGFNNIGEQNIQMARDILASHQIEVIGEHVGGEVGRKVFFYTADGRVQVASLKQSA
jgi:chemotaxis protein CheD